MFVKAFDDYMQGPKIFRNDEPEALHSYICKYSKSHSTQTIVPNSNTNIDEYEITKTGKFQKLISLLTLNGHLLPKFLIRDSIALIQDSLTEQERDSICKGFARKGVIIFTKKIPHSYQNELDNQAGINILTKWVKSAILGRLRWTRVSAEWKEAEKDLSSIQFWQSYLQTHR
jgi:galactofuranosylgalactofuranosylrhamnosyl-N-acetylglucosaminyl-diphospho-decaprenol beta-1,5/1,6-galactofuranosyltransferase